MPEAGGRTNGRAAASTTAEEAALAVARFLGPQGVAASARAARPPAAPEPAPMTAAEAHAAAAAEGLALVRAENATGFKGVGRRSRADDGGGGARGSKPFRETRLQEARGRKAQLTRLGKFATAEEAALAVARFLGPAGAAAPPAAASAPPRRSGAGPSAPPSKRGKQPADDDEEEYVVKAEAVSDDDDAPDAADARRRCSATASAPPRCSTGGGCAPSWSRATSASSAARMSDS